MCFWLALSLFSILFHCSSLVFVLIVKRVQIVETAFDHISRRLKFSPKYPVACHLFKSFDKTRSLVCWHNIVKMIYAQRETNADPKDCYCGEKGCPGRAANRFRQVLVYQFMAPFTDFMDSGFRPTETNGLWFSSGHLHCFWTDQSKTAPRMDLLRVARFVKLACAVRNKDSRYDYTFAQCARTHLKVPGWSLAWNALLTKKLPIFCRDWTKLMEVAKGLLPYRNHFEVVWSSLEWWILLRGCGSEMSGWNVRVNGILSLIFSCVTFVVLTADGAGRDDGPLEQQKQEIHVCRRNRTFPLIQRQNQNPHYKVWETQLYTQLKFISFSAVQI